MLFSLVFLSAVLRENLSSFRSTVHNLSHIVLWNVRNWSLLRSKGKVQNWERRLSYYLNLCETHGLNTWGQLPHLMKMAENSVLCWELRAPRFLGFYRLVHHALLHLRLRHRYRRTMNFYCVSSNSTKWEYEWTSTKRPVTNPVTGRLTSTGKPVTAWIAMKKGVTRKEFALTSWKNWNCELQEGQNYLDSMQETHKWSHTSSSKIGENW